MEGARRHFEEALKLYRQLVQQNPDTYLPYLATTLNEAANVARRENRLDDARLRYEEALRDFRQLALEYPDPNLLNTATTLSDLAGVDRRQHRLDDARQHLEEALKIRRQLAQQRSGYPTAGDGIDFEQYRKPGWSPEPGGRCAPAFEESLRTYRQLAKQDPGSYVPGLAIALGNLGSLDTAQGRMGRRPPVL